MKSNNLTTFTLKTENLIFVGTYLDFKRSSDWDEFLYHLFQFLSFINQIEGKKLIESDKIYFSFEITPKEFLEFLGKNQNHYQLTKIVQFIRIIEKSEKFLNALAQRFFDSPCLFSKLSIEKTRKNNSWVLFVRIPEEIYFYQYPFFLPNSFLRPNNRYDEQIKIKLFQSITTASSEKRINVK